MHQGNLKVAANGDVIAYDFGIMGRIDEYTRRVYAEILMGFIRKDYRRVAEVHFEAGYVSPDRDIDEFARACAPWASRSSAWTPAGSRWRGFWPISLK
jgi:ubiquinone biosynthesis protein